MKIRGNEVLWLSEKGNVAVTYAQFDLGAKYKIFRKVKYGDIQIMYDSIMESHIHNGDIYSLGLSEK